MFINGFELETLTPARNPKTKGVPSPPVAETSQPIVAKPQEFEKLKPRKQVEKRAEQTKILDTPTPSPAK